MRRGRRTSLTHDLSDRIAGEIARGATLLQACRNVGSNPPSVYRWIGLAREGCGSPEEMYLLARVTEAEKTRGSPAYKPFGSTAGKTLLDDLRAEIRGLEVRVARIEAATFKIGGEA